MGNKSFQGGVHPPYHKEPTQAKATRVLPPPPIVVLHLQQHIGAVAKPTVKRGDMVYAGQLVGEAAHPMSTHVHSPVSGKVAAVEPRLHINGQMIDAVVIENDGEEQWQELETPANPLDLSPEDIRQKVYEAGIVGLGGAGFPTSIKMQHSDDIRIEYLIINGCECEPYITADHRTMLEQTDALLLGSQLLAKAVRARQILIAIEDNKPDAIKLLQERCDPDEITIAAVKAKYPQGGERQLIKTLTGREVPSNGLPFQVGCVTFAVPTAAATAQALQHGRPLTGRIITVSGKGIKRPGNLFCSIGTPIKYLLDAVGGLTDDPGKIIVNGPMMGFAQHDVEVPLIKACSGLLVLTQSEIQRYAPSPCIRCSRCVDACPTYLLPLKLEAFSQREQWDEAAEYGALDCIECGCCTYICPAKRHLLHWIRLAKKQIIAAERRQADKIGQTGGMASG